MSQPADLMTPTNGTEPSPPQIEAAPSPGGETEVLPRARRRSFPAAYKRRLLQEVDRCTQPGQVGALLRREGLYSSHLTLWRRQRDLGELGLPQRGPSPADPATKEVERLRRENDRLQKRLEQAETIIAVQKKLSHLLGLADEAPPKGDNR